MVPNAQAITGAYWRYEDFTHEQLFTTGSLYYVLLDNGFDEIKFLDIYATSNIRFPLNFIRFLSINASNLFGVEDSIFSGNYEPNFMSLKDF